MNYQRSAFPLPPGYPSQVALRPCHGYSQFPLSRPSGRRAPWRVPDSCVAEWGAPPARWMEHVRDLSPATYKLETWFTAQCLWIFLKLRGDSEVGHAYICSRLISPRVGREHRYTLAMILAHFFRFSEIHKWKCFRFRLLIISLFLFIIIRKFRNDPIVHYREREISPSGLKMTCGSS